MSQDDQASRLRLQKALEGADAVSLALLAEIDRRLGLRWEARDGFRRALAANPGDVALRSALASVEDLIAGEKPSP